MIQSIGYAAKHFFSSLKPFEFERRDPEADDIVGALAPLEPVNNMQVAFHRRCVAGSLIGSIAETQEVLDFCAAHNIVADAEIIPITDVNEAYDRVEKGDVKFRFVIDMATLRQEASAE